MCARTLPIVAVLFLLVLAVPHPVLSQTEVSVIGVVVSIQNWQGTFVLQELSSGSQGRHWTVRLTASTEVRRSQSQGVLTRGPQPTLSMLRVGDLVQVQGSIVGNELFARFITVNSGSAGIGQGPAGIRQQVRLSGTIVDLQARGQGILQLQAQSPVQGGNLWTVRLHPQTQVIGLGRDRGRTNGNGRGGRAALRLLRVGDFVEVVGRVLGNQQIRAEQITVHGQSSLSPVPPFPGQVPYPNPVPFPGQAPYPTPVYPGQTVIISPHQGAEIPAGEFAVIGQTMPGAQVRVDVTAQVAVVQLPVTSGTVTADYNGVFAFTARPPIRVPGTTYTITVTSTYQGYASPPVSVTVRQL